MRLQGKSPGSTASPQSVFQVTGSRPTPLALLALSLTDPTLLSSCSSALLNSALLWMAAMASGCSCLMAWQASLGRRETEGRAGLKTRCQAIWGSYFSKACRPLRSTTQSSRPSTEEPEGDEQGTGGLVGLSKNYEQAVQKTQAPVLNPAKRLKGTAA